MPARIHIHCFLFNPTKILGRFGTELIVTVSRFVGLDSETNSPILRSPFAVVNESFTGLADFDVVVYDVGAQYFVSATVNFPSPLPAPGNWADGAQASFPNSGGFPVAPDGTTPLSLFGGLTRVS